MSKSKNTLKNHRDGVEIFTCACEREYVCVCLGYSCVLLCMKIHTQHDKLGVVYWMGECSWNEHCYSRREKKFFISMCRWL